MAQTPTKGLIRVYYDGLCGLCRREIVFYQKIQPVGVFEWVDITQSAEPLTKQGISLETALKHLHVQDAQGEWHVGVDAFLMIWRGLGGFWALLAKVVALPGLLTFAKLLYNLFAVWRFKRLSHCKISSD
jgi:predicted DCC family thiol-disulfide oxidoreductase YuxK